MSRGAGGGAGVKRWHHQGAMQTVPLAMQEYCSVNLGAILQSVGDNTFEEEKLISVSQFAQQDCSDAGLG